jgi:transcriptional regulator of acetoin/glycerol metabolism
MEAANALCRNEVMDIEDLLPVVSAQESGETPLTLEEVERRHIVKVLEYTNRNMVETARLLGIGRSTLYNKLNQYDLKD